jgi:hypothetical protein
LLAHAHAFWSVQAKTLGNRYASLATLSRGEQPCERKDDEQRYRVNHSLHPGRLIGVTDECVQHTTNETAVAKDIGCIPNGPVQGGDEATLLKEYDTLRGKSRSKEGNQGRCDTKQVPCGNFDEAEKRKSTDGTTEQQSDYASG